jgi:glycosyltransferase involved in cell wall biosynthesis
MMAVRPWVETRARVSKVLLVAYHFPPIGGGGVQRALKFARYLPDHGYDPIVVTGPGRSEDLWAPEDRSMLDEVRATRVNRIDVAEPDPPGRWQRAAERALDRLSAFERWWLAGVERVGERVGRETDVILGELIPYSTAVATARLARRLNVPWIADLQDPWALDEMWVYPTDLHRLHDARRMRRLLGTASAVIMNTPEAVARVLSEFPELAKHPVVSIPNGFDPADFEGQRPPRDPTRFRIVHTGYLHTALGLRHRSMRGVRSIVGGMPIRGVDYLTRSHVFLLQAVDELIRLEPELASVIEVHLAGVLTEADRKFSRTSRVVVEHGYVTHAESVALLRSADLLFLPMHSLPPGKRAGLVPGKTYEYIASGTPILAAVPEGDARDILEEVGTAAICEPSDVLGMIELLRVQLARWREGREPPAPRPDVLARYTRRQQTAQLAELLGDVVNARVSTRRRPEPATKRTHPEPTG